MKITEFLPLKVKPFSLRTPKIKPLKGQKQATKLMSAKFKQQGHEVLNRSPEYTDQSQTFNFEI